MVSRRSAGPERLAGFQRHIGEDGGVGIDILFDVDAPHELDEFARLRTLMRALGIDRLAHRMTAIGLSRISHAR